jgi:hypothetical protein
MKSPFCGLMTRGRSLGICLPLFASAISVAVPIRATDTSSAATISVQYFRGICTMGTIGASCNSAGDCGTGGACGVTASSVDDTTVVSSLQGAVMDLYRGQTTTAGGVGALTYPESILSAPACWMADWTLADTGALDITADPNPPMDTFEYYDYTIDAGFGTSNNVNQMDCSNPGICENPGWCELGTTPGVRCTMPSDCNGGNCVIIPTGCTTDAGSAPLGKGSLPPIAGCSSHTVCDGGGNVGQLCISDANYPSAFCNAPPATAGFCVNVNLSAGPISADGCPPVNDPLVVTRVVPDAVITACP